MCVLKTLVLSALVCVSWSVKLKFPPKFKFGAATSAYQIEGGWNASDKGVNIWDHFTHTNPEAIADNSNGDVACDSYKQWKRDVQMTADLGLDHYRFSLSWARILPTGFPNRISKDGVRYYNNLIDELLAKGVEPLVTIYHWELPQRLQDLGGWTNPLISDWFADYARVAYSLFGDRVKTWLTINEPIVVCEIGYGTSTIAPGLNDPGIANLLCNKNILIAHAKAYRIYDKEFRSKYKGRVSLANQASWLEPATEAEEQITEIARQLMAGMYSHPIFSKKGGWPPVLEQIIAQNSKTEGYPHSRLPKFTPEEIRLCKGTYDYYGLNHYTSRLVRYAEEGEEIGAWFMSGSSELNVVLEVDPSWDPGVTFMPSYPVGMRRLLAWLKKEYGDIEILITENGYPRNRTELEDDKRIRCLRDYLEQILLSIYKDRVNVIGYTVWSLMDNFEWGDGYTTKFGLYEVDFSSPNRTRTPRKSARFYSSLARTHCLDPDTV